MRRGKNRAGRFGETSITRTLYRAVITQARTTSGETYGETELKLSNLGDRAATIGEGFEFFRLKTLHAYSFVDTQVPGTSVAVAGAVNHQLAFINSPTGSTAAPTTPQIMAQWEHYVTSGAMERIKLRVGPRDLLSEPLKWYNTFNTGSIPANQLSAGQIVYALRILVGTTVTSVAQFVVIEGIVEFHTPIDTGSSLTVHVPRQLAEDPAVAKAAEKLRSAVAVARTDL